MSVDVIDEIVSEGVQFGQVSKEGREHVLRPYWRGGDLWSTECAPRNIYPRLGMYSVDDAPSGGLHGPCLQPGCRRERARWLKVNEGSKR